jgi:hypothetical protein
MLVRAAALRSCSFPQPDPAKTQPARAITREGDGAPAVLDEGELQRHGEPTVPYGTRTVLPRRHCPRQPRSPRRLSITNGCSLDPVEALAGHLRRAWHGKGGRQGWRTQSARLNRMFLAHVDAEMVSGTSGPRIGCASWRASTKAGSAVQKAPPSRDTPASLGLRGTAGPSCGWTWFGGADDGLRQPEP